MGHLISNETWWVPDISPSRYFWLSMKFHISFLMRGKWQKVNLFLWGKKNYEVALWIFPLLSNNFRLCQSISAKINSSFRKEEDAGSIRCIRVIRFSKVLPLFVLLCNLRGWIRLGPVLWLTSIYIYHKIIQNISHYSLRRW